LGSETTSQVQGDRRTGSADLRLVGRSSDAAIAGQIVSNLRWGRTFVFT